MAKSQDRRWRQMPFGFAFFPHRFLLFRSRCKEQGSSSQETAGPRFQAYLYAIVEIVPKRHERTRASRSQPVTPLARARYTAPENEGEPFSRARAGTDTLRCTRHIAHRSPTHPKAKGKTKVTAYRVPTRTTSPIHLKISQAFSSPQHPLASTTHQKLSASICFLVRMAPLKLRVRHSVCLERQDIAGLRCRNRHLPALCSPRAAWEADGLTRLQGQEA